MLGLIVIPTEAEASLVILLASSAVPSVAEEAQNLVRFQGAVVVAAAVAAQILHQYASMLRSNFSTNLRISVLSAIFR
jgi:hypothetical protein